MWTDTTRAHHARAGLALPSDLTDTERAVLEPFLPPCFPPVSTARRWFCLWRDDGLWRDLNHYAGEKLRGALRGIGKWTIEIIKRSDSARGFELLPRRDWGSAGEIDPSMILHPPSRKKSGPAVW